MPPSANNVNALHVQLIEVSGRLERVSARQEEICQRQDATQTQQAELLTKLDDTLRGDVDRPGIVTRVDRLEQEANRRRGWAAALWTVLGAFFASLAAAVWGK